MRYTFIPPQPKNSAALEGHYCTGVYTLYLCLEWLNGFDLLTKITALLFSCVLIWQTFLLG